MRNSYAYILNDASSAQQQYLLIHKYYDVIAFIKLKFRQK